MALPGNPLPFGIRDIKLRALDATDTPGSSVDLPAGRTLSFTESEDYEDLRGDDALVAQHGNGPSVDWDLEGGGISLDALKIITGGTVTTTGVTPNIKKTLAKKGLDARPNFQIEGQSIGDAGGDTHIIIYKCKATGDVGGEFGEGAFFLTGASGTGIPNSSDKLWDLVQNETAVAVT